MEKFIYDGKSHDFKEVDVDYWLVYDYFCTECRHRWRLSKVSKNAQCPKCKSIKLYYMSKRSDSEFFPEDSVIQIPQDSELM